MLIKEETVFWMSNDSEPLESENLLIKLKDEGKTLFSMGVFKGGEFLILTSGGLLKINRHEIIAWGNFPQCEMRH